MNSRLHSITSSARASVLVYPIVRDSNRLKKTPPLDQPAIDLKHTNAITTFAAKAEGLLTFSATPPAEPFKEAVRDPISACARHCEVPLQIGQRFRRPLLEFRIPPLA